MQDIQFASIINCKAQWLELGGDSDYGGCLWVVFADLPVLEDLELLFERDTLWTKDVSDAKLELQKVWELLRDVLPILKMSVSTESVRILKFEREVIQKIKWLVEESQALKRTVIDEKGAWQGLEKKLTELKASVSASSASGTFGAKLEEPEKPLEAARVEVSSLKERVPCVVTEKKYFYWHVANDRISSEPRKVRLNAGLVDCNWTEKLTHSLVTESV